MKPETIFALSTPNGKSGIAVVRVSGKSAMYTLEKLGVKQPIPRIATKAKLIDPVTNDPIDNALVIYFQKPFSFTGEDLVEYQIHGGRSVITHLLTVLSTFQDVRVANAGEFTKRAFENNKMDLTEAEGLADLIESETRMQGKQALRQMDGALGSVFNNWREELIRVLSYLEAMIDFSDEEIPDNLILQAREGVSKLISILKKHLEDYRRAEKIRDGIQIAILGEPNVGKSSLLNSLANREIAIVSKNAGTTRDIIESFISIGGYPVTLFDTAGIREKANDVEAEGIRRALKRGQEADLKIIVLDSSEPKENNRHIQNLTLGDSILVWNKIDLLGKKELMGLKSEEGIAISAKTNEGLDHLLGRLEKEVVLKFGLSESAIITRLRHKEALERCIIYLEGVWDKDGKMLAIELAAEELRLAAQELGRVTGALGVEDLLEKIFSDFCIGK